ncbi:MAG: D-sedoheptulose 7-phosphate isomerase [Bacteroidia bacterium]
MSRVRQHFEEAQKTLTLFLSDEQAFVALDQAIEAMAKALDSGHKIISCGNGGSHCDAMHFAEELSGRYRANRKALAAMAISDPSHLSCVGNDYGYEFVFSRFVEAVGQPGDVLLGISTSGQSQNVLRAIEAAKEKGMICIGLTGKDGGQMASVLDIEIRAPHSQYADRAQEIHIKAIHSMIDGIEQALGLS